MISVALEQIRFFIGDNLILDNISLNIEPGELFFLLGPSGCGKTTLLRILAGFYQPTVGKILFNEQPINNVPAYQRNIGMVFQNYALFPHLSVYKNVEYGLKTRNLPIAERKKKVIAALELVKLSGYEKRTPGTLSGGEQQRVALARALVISPDLLLLDEPLANLDAKLRIEMRDEIRSLHQESAVTTIYVTHDCKEALSLADRIAVMRAGKILQVGAPKEIYYQPFNNFVAGFIGETNFVHGTIQQIQEDNQVIIQTEIGKIIAIKPAFSIQTNQAVICSIRPEVIQIIKKEGTGMREEKEQLNQIQAEIVSTSFQGEQEQIVVRLPNNLAWKSVVNEAKAISVKPGEKIYISFKPEDVIVLKD